MFCIQKNWFSNKTKTMIYSDGQMVWKFLKRLKIAKNHEVLQVKITKKLVY